MGELHSRSPYLFNGYWNRPAATASAMPGGWCSAGDLARRNKDGFLYIVDRKTDMIITGGVNVYPREVEEVLAHHRVAGRPPCTACPTPTGVSRSTPSWSCVAPPPLPSTSSWRGPLARRLPGAEGGHVRGSAAPQPGRKVLRRVLRDVAARRASP